MMKKTPVTYSDFEALKKTIEGFQKSHLDSSLNFQSCIITSFVEHSNIVSILLDNGKEISSMPLVTSAKLVLMFLGPTTEIKDIPGIVFYSYVPSDGFVMIGDINAFQYDSSELDHNKPFYF